LDPEEKGAEPMVYATIRMDGSPEKAEEALEILRNK